ADDDADDLELITGFFRQYNQDVHVLVFKDGKEVLKFLDDFSADATKPVLIVLDISMPRLNGKETLALMRKNPVFRYVPVVILSTSSSAADESFCKELGASWITKSPSMEGVRETARLLAEFCDLGVIKKP